MKCWGKLVVIVGLLVGTAWLPLRAATNQTATELVNPGKLTRTGSVVHLPGLTVYGGKEKKIVADGKMALTDGILEFVAVEPKGRDYESLFTINCKPSELQFALLLIGCQTGAVPYQVKSGKRVGTALRLEAEWQVKGKTHRVAVEKLLINRNTNKMATGLKWIFTGSEFVKDPVTGREVFQADAEQAFIALWWEPSIIINLGNEFGNPYHGDEQGFAVNKTAVPPQGTPIKLIIHKAGK